MQNKIATIFGGTGFLGRHIVKELAKRGVIVKVVTRVPERAFFLKPSGNVGQIVPVVCDYNDPASIAKAIRGSDYVINTIGILYERGFKTSFQRLHTELPAMIAAACKKEKAQRFVHISALGVDKSNARYAQTKLAGEAAIFSNFKGATILRPSVIFGEDDNFFNMFAKLARYCPILPLIGGGKTRFQPVYVDDVARACVTALNKPESVGQLYELGGPDIVNFKDIYQKLFHYTARERAVISLPFWIAKIEAAFLSLFPKPLLTPDQVESLKTDNVVSVDALGFQDLGLIPTGMDLILPMYLAQYRKGGRFADVASV